MSIAGQPAPLAGTTDQVRRALSAWAPVAMAALVVLALLIAVVMASPPADPPAPAARTDQAVPE